MKKFLIPLIIVIVIGIIAGVLFFFRNTSIGEGGRTIGSFFPFGNNVAEIDDTLFPSDTNVDGLGVDTQGDNSPITPLRQIHNKPVSSFVSMVKDDKKPYVRFMERSLGNIYESNMSGVEKNRISNETFPAIYNAIWNSTGDGIAFTQLADDKITTFTANLNDNTGTSTNSLFSEGSYLPEQIISSASFGDKIFYIYPTDSGSVGTIANFNGGSKNIIFDSQLTEWLASWVNKNTILLTTKPSAEIPGYAYILDIAKKKTTKVVGNIKGLTTLMSPDKKLVVYTEASSGGIGTLLYNTDTSEAFPLALNTFPEKCVWSTKSSSTLYCSSPNIIPRGTYPDDWYKGVVSFSDSIWEINTSANTANILSVLSIDAGEDIDAVKLALSPNEDYLVFINKKDSTLWSLRLIEPELPDKEEIDTVVPDEIIQESQEGI